MPTAETLSHLRDTVDASKGDFLALAKQLADGADVDADKITDTCKAADKTVFDLQELVECLQRRAQMRDEYAAREQLRAEFREIRAKLDEEEAEWKAVQQKREQELRPFQYRLIEINEQLAATADIPKQLAESCPDKSLAQKAKQLSMREIQLRNEGVPLRSQLHTSIGRLRHDAAMHRVSIDRDWLDESVDHTALAIEETDPLGPAKRQVQRARQVQIDLERRIADLTREANRIHRAMIEF